MAEVSPPAGSEAKSAVSPGVTSSGGTRRSGLASQSMGRFAPGTIFAARYRIIGLLGKGGMGEVYRADDLTLDQAVALKFLPESVAADLERLERFLNEVRVARQVSHPNVCRLYDIGQVEGQHFISMEYIDGEDLASLLRRIGRLPNDKALEIARQMCAGLAAAHEKGVLHRDFKPANIMIDGQGKVRIADFGLARSAQDQRDPKSIEGTPAYMAPEQFTGKGESVQSDVYSLGLVLYEMFTGKPAFKAATVSELVRLHRESNPTNPSVHITDLDPVVEGVILRCLEKDPTLRPASALAVSAALPGGDPLRAALAAGETPSPEMVAAAGDQGALRPPLAWAALGYILAALLTVMLLAGKTSLLSWIPQTKGPDALAERSRDLIKKLGYTQEPFDTAFGYEETDYLRELSKGASRWGQLKLGQPPGLVFWFRQSPHHLMNSSFYSVGVVRHDDPPQKTPDMVGLQLDTGGRLVRLDAFPRLLDTADGATAVPDWNSLFLEAGLDIATFKAASPILTPPVFADARMAWDGTYPRRSDVPIHVEAAAFRGKPVFFRIFQPWNRPSPAEPERTGTAKKAVHISILVLLIGVLAGTFLLAWHNLKLNRGDRRGALRISAYLVLLEISARILQAHLVPDLGEMLGLIWMILSRALMFGAFVWVGYIALEPHIRRLWPHTMISWSRLLAGQFRDPRIGRDILVGGVFGITIPLLEEVVFLIASKLGSQTEPALATAGTVNAALSARNYIGSLSTQLTSAVSGAVYLILFLFLLRLVLRKDWLAISVFIAAVTADGVMNRPNPWLSAFLALLVFPALIFLLRRFGLFAVMVFMTFINLPSVLPVTDDFSLWFSNASVFTLLFLAGLAIYGFRTALAGKPAFAVDLLTE